jgi:hypothetical protein
MPLKLSDLAKQQKTVPVEVDGVGSFDVTYAPHVLSEKFLKILNKKSNVAAKIEERADELEAEIASGEYKDAADKRKKQKKLDTLREELEKAQAIVFKHQARLLIGVDLEVDDDPDDDASEGTHVVDTSDPEDMAQIPQSISTKIMDTVMGDADEDTDEAGKDE